MSGLFAGTPLEQPVTCEACGKVLEDCRCPRDADGHVRLPRDQPVRVHREKRRGKWTTVITGLDSHATDLKALLRELRSTLATGGSVGGTPEAPVIELQGDHCDRLLAMLQDRGYPARRAGG